MQCPEGINGSTPMDIVAVIDISGSMDSAATVEQGGKQVRFSRVSNTSMFCYRLPLIAACRVQISVGFTVLDVTKHAVKTLIASMRPTDRLCIVTFGVLLYIHIYIFSTNPATCHMID